MTKKTLKMFGTKAMRVQLSGKGTFIGNGRIMLLASSEDEKEFAAYCKANNKEIFGGKEDVAKLEDILDEDNVRLILEGPLFMEKDKTSYYHAYWRTSKNYCVFGCCGKPIADEEDCERLFVVTKDEYSALKSAGAVGYDGINYGDLRCLIGYSGKMYNGKPEVIGIVCCIKPVPVVSLSYIGITIKGLREVQKKVAVN